MRPPPEPDAQAHDATPAPGIRDPAPTGNPPCAAAPGSFAAVVQRVAPSLVTVLGPAGPATDWPWIALPAIAPEHALSPPRAGADQGALPLGAGFFLDARGTIVTSARVVGEATELSVRLGGRTAQARLRGIDPDIDLAVLVVPGAQGRALPVGGRSGPRVGDWVGVVADPQGSGPTLSVGVVRSTPTPAGPGQDPGPMAGLLAVDAGIDRANWGGAVVDTAGALVGLATSASSPGSRTGAVLTADRLRRGAADLLAYGRPMRASLGLWLRPLDERRARELGLGEGQGLVVTRTAAGGPADRSGVVADDVIVDFAGTRVRSAAQIARLASETPQGDTVPVLIRRGDRTVVVRLEPAPSDEWVRLEPSSSDEQP